MSLSDSQRTVIADAIESNNAIKEFIAARAPSVGVVRQFAQGLVTVNSVEVSTWTISYPFESGTDPKRGIIHAVDELSTSVRSEVDNRIHLLDVSSQSLDEIMNRILQLPGVLGTSVSAADLQADASLCIRLDYALGGDASPTCTANVCPKHG